MNGRYFCRLNRPGLIAAFSVIFCLAAAARETPQRHGRGGSDPARYETSDRDAWQLPDSVAAVLKIKQGQVVADIGAASGYFARRFAKVVGPAGRVLAADIDTLALGYLAQVAEKNGLSNLDTVHAAADDPHLSPGSVDLVFICNTLHHIGGRVAYLKRLKGALKPAGRVAVVDFFKRNIPVGPRSLSHKLSRDEAAGAFREAGYSIVGEYDFLPYQYFFVAGIDNSIKADVQRGLK